MTMVSKNRLAKEYEERIRELLVGAFADIKNKKEMASFLLEFLTPTERMMLAKRLAIAILLLKEHDMRSISQILKVSTNTIININYWMKYQTGEFKKQVEKILKKEQDEEFWSKIGYALDRMAIPSSSDWKGARRQAEHDRRKHKHTI